MEIEGVDVWSASRTMGALYAGFGVVAAVFFVPMMLFSAAIGMVAEDGGAALGALGLLGALFMALMMPVIYGVMGMIAGALMALLYNLVSRSFGGIRLRIRMLDEG